MREPPFGISMRLCASAGIASMAAKAAARIRTADLRMVMAMSSFDRSDELYAFILLQLLHDPGQFGLRHSGNCDAHSIEAAGGRAAGERQLVGIEKFGDVVGGGLRRETDHRVAAVGRCARRRRRGLIAASRRPL